MVIKVVISDGPRVGCRRGRGEIGSLRRPPSAKGRQGKRSGGIKGESYVFMDVPKAPSTRWIGIIKTLFIWPGFDYLPVI